MFSNFYSNIFLYFKHKHIEHIKHNSAKIIDFEIYKAIPATEHLQWR